MEVTSISVKLDGIADIMFNRFIDHCKERRPPEQKLYLDEGNGLVLPSCNIVEGFLFSREGNGCAKSFNEIKEYKQYVSVGLSHVFIKEALIPICGADGKQVKYKSFDKQKDLFRVDMSAGVTKGGIKQEAQPRPVLKLPWSVSFEVSILKNDLIDEHKLHGWFNKGGMQIGLCNYRPRHGRFMVSEWKVK